MLYRPTERTNRAESHGLRYRNCWLGATEIYSADRAGRDKCLCASTAQACRWCLRQWAIAIAGEPGPRIGEGLGTHRTFKSLPDHDLLVGRTHHRIAGLARECLSEHGHIRG